MFAETKESAAAVSPLEDTSPIQPAFEEARHSRQEATAPMSHQDENIIPQLTAFPCSCYSRTAPKQPLKLNIVPATLDKNDIPERPEPLIIDLLRQGGTLLLAGPSKSGKSYLATQLALAVASGGVWLGFSVKRGKTVYLNMEIDDIEFMNRVADIGNAMGADSDLVKANALIVKRIREDFNMGELVGSLLDKYKDEPPMLIIIDPIYMLVGGDENFHGPMKEVCRQLDRLALGLGCAVVAVHHHSKGPQRYKQAVDRASGSGVFGRYFDAIVDITELGSDSGVRGMMAEFVLRDYPEHEPVFYSFDGRLCNLVDATQAIAMRERNAAARMKQALETKQVEEACEALLCKAESKWEREDKDGTPYVKRDEVLAYLGWEKSQGMKRKFNAIIDGRASFVVEVINNNLSCVMRG